jgi:hypothetical protein
LEQETVAIAVPWEEAGLMHCSHLINFIYIVYDYVYVYVAFNFTLVQ